jgi:excisionase family DNA binding protein
MTHPQHLREKAIELRRQDLTIDEIAERLALSRSTIYCWVRDLKLSRRGMSGRQTAAQRRATASMQRRCAGRREYSYECGREEFPRLAEDPTFRDFVAMYIGEGCKRCRNRVSLGNSDPAVVELANIWIQRFAINKVSWSIQYHADQNLQMLREFWSNRLGIEPSTSGSSASRTATSSPAERGGLSSAF